jgi:hypothetical protein
MAVQIRGLGRGLAQRLSGYAHHASRTVVAQLVHGGAFRAWATRPSALLDGVTPIDACIERDLVDLVDLERRGSLRKRYGAYARDGVEKAHARIRSWAATRARSLEPNG